MGFSACASSDQYGIQNRFGALFFIVLNTLFSKMNGLRVFAGERAIMFVVGAVCCRSPGSLACAWLQQSSASPYGLGFVCVYLCAGQSP
jgi:hypothetical protein